MDPALQRKDEVRLRLLQYFWRTTDGDTSVGFSINEKTASTIGATLQETGAAAAFLKGEGLLEQTATEAFLITHPGVVEAEQSLRDPTDGTNHFTQAVIQIVNGPVGNVPTVTHPVIHELRAKANSLPPEQRDEAESVIDHIESLLEKGPKALAPIRAMMTGLVTYFPEAVPWLTSQAQLIARALGS